MTRRTVWRLQEQEINKSREELNMEERQRSVFGIAKQLQRKGRI